MEATDITYYYIAPPLPVLSRAEGRRLSLYYGDIIVFGLSITL